MTSATPSAGSKIVSQAFLSERGRLLRFIRKRIPTDADAEDILQDVFYQLSAHYTVENPIEKISSWLFTVAGNKVRDWYRKRKDGHLEDALASRSQSADEDTGMASEKLLASDDVAADDLMGHAYFWAELESALQQLPEEQREVFMLHALEDKSFKEIAEATNAPVNTLLSRKRYAVLFLRERLKEIYNEIINF